MTWGQPSLLKRSFWKSPGLITIQVCTGLMLFIIQPAYKNQNQPTWEKKKSMNYIWVWFLSLLLLSNLLTLSLFLVLLIVSSWSINEKYREIYYFICSWRNKSKQGLSAGGLLGKWQAEYIYLGNPAMLAKMI